jgi:trehalose 6-phosphate synthase/phosphatase
MKPLKQIEFQRIIIAAYRLPFKVVKKNNKYYAIQNTGGLVSAILSLAGKINPDKRTRLKIVWVGTGEQHHTEVTINPDFEIVPVEISRKVNDKYYGGFCNDTIWPLCHRLSGTGNNEKAARSYHCRIRRNIYHLLFWKSQPEQFQSQD